MKQAIFILIILFLASCKGENMEVIRFAQKEENNLSQELENLANKKVYFGHQSVGYNIIDGIREILDIEYPGVKINIKETRQPHDFDLALFAHTVIGQNQAPISKIDDFKKLMESGIGNKVDIAFFKFCFVDIEENTDIKEVFRLYADAIAVLEAEYPQVKFTHCTVPLTVLKAGVKARVKQLLGKYLPEKEGDNQKRGIFNQMLKAKYGNKVFDLAAIESTYPDGSKAELTRGNGRLAYLIPEYSDDGGHLNQLGKLRVAKELIRFLSDN